MSRSDRPQLRRALLGYRRADVDALLAERTVDDECARPESERIHEKTHRELEEARARVRELKSVEAELLRSIAAVAATPASELVAPDEGEEARLDSITEELASLTERLGGLTEEAGERSELVVRRSAEDEARDAVRLDVGPVGDFDTLARFMDAVGLVEGVRRVTIERFSGGRAVLAVGVDGSIDLLEELTRLSGVRLVDRGEDDDRPSVVDLADWDKRKAA